MHLVADGHVKVPALQGRHLVREGAYPRAGLGVPDLLLPDLPRLRELGRQAHHRGQDVEGVACVVLGVGHEPVLAVVDRVHVGLGEQHGAGGDGLAHAAGHADEGALVGADEGPSHHAARAEDGVPDVLLDPRLQLEGLAVALGVVAHEPQERPHEHLAHEGLVPPGLGEPDLAGPIHRPPTSPRPP